jgi:hypothetical protein
MNDKINGAYIFRPLVIKILSEKPSTHFELMLNRISKIKKAIEKSNRKINQ